MAAEPKGTAGDDLPLPPEIWREILTKLPAKSILRFRSVRKSWYSLVSCPNFISDYTARNLNKNPNRLLLKLYDTKAQVCSFSSHDELFAESREHNDFPDQFLGSQVRIVGSCNGLICLSKNECVDDVEVITFVIWNPTIRKVVELPSRHLCSNSAHYSYYGFGFDSKTGDHKVLCSHSARADLNREDDICSYAGSNVCEVFDLRRGVWRGISPLVRLWNIWGGTPECYLDGAIHWTRSRHIRSSRIILSFNMSDEVFREIRMPDCPKLVSNVMGTRCVTFGGLIHMIIWTCEWYYDRNGDCSVWTMKEYGVTESWTKLFKLQTANVSQNIDPYKFRLWENGQVLMVHDLPNDDSTGLRGIQGLVLYNTESTKYKQLFSVAKCLSDMCIYEESLVLM